jgi:hypothetical protein
MLRWISIWVLALSDLSAILVGLEKACSSSSRRESGVIIDIGSQTVSNRQHLPTFLQQAHHCRFLAIAFAETKLVN